MLQNWNPGANRENCAPSATEVLRLINETLDAFFQLPIAMHRDLLPDLLVEVDKSLQHYAMKVKSGCGKCHVNCKFVALAGSGIS